ncbi:hypothetical protein [Winogradskyella aquimaris]|uniref:Tellurite resistance protein TerB n=1 Tax=Winogradskyella aquimaris TaxID=864074 RepID=A0ABU5EQD8_9FLAO|nr:hypothetical protein [Winogradskyella aquimaris]MDY2587925.1 hypothetical protein [Winogradskyella aquimaris]
MTRTLLIHLAHLFYAISKVDGNLAFDEYTTLSESLKNRWHHLTDAQLEVVKNQFNTLQRNNISSKESFSTFIEFAHQNPNLFTEELKTIILKTANDIAYAFAKINKSELNLMVNLSLEFKKLSI